MAAAIRALGDPSEAGPAADPRALAPLHSTPEGGWRTAHAGGGNGRPGAVWDSLTSSPVALTCLLPPETSLGRRLTPPVGPAGAGCVQGHVPRSLHKPPWCAGPEGGRTPQNRDLRATSPWPSAPATAGTRDRRPRRPREASPKSAGPLLGEQPPGGHGGQTGAAHPPGESHPLPKRPKPPSRGGGEERLPRDFTSCKASLPLYQRGTLL